ncbi:ribose ABC transporter permease [Halobacteriales archaeon QS_1_68_20]|nr:MAG: ribose ABC transporter permease [Halobacteriales archaeon QS_1_68_20]
MSDGGGPADGDGSSDGDWRDRGRDVLERLVDASAIERMLISLAALVASLIVGAVIVLAAGLLEECERGFVVGGDVISIPFTGMGVQLPAFEAAVPGVANACYSPMDVYYQLFVAPFTSSFDLALTLKETTLLLFTGLSVAVAFRAGLFNIGTQGQLVLGGLGTALAVLWVAPLVPGGLVGTLILVPLGLLVGAVVGGLYGAVPGALKAYADANEVITTIMLNFVATGVAFYLVSAYVQDPGSQSTETESLPGYAQLSPEVEAFSGTDFSVVALLLGAVLVGAVYYLLWHTAFGYELRTSGLQPAAAAYSGVDSERMIVTSMFLSGALGGVGGAIYVMMVLGRWRAGVPPLGFDGITVSILAGNNPLGVALASGLFGTLKSGSLSIEFALGVPSQLVEVLRGLVILFVAMPEFFRMLGIRYDVGGSGGDPVETPETESDPADGAVETDGGVDGAVETDGGVDRSVETDGGVDGAVETAGGPGPDGDAGGEADE